MKDKIIKQLFSYWDDLRGDRIAPTRAEIDPRKIKGTLEHTFILEAVKTGSPKFRLAGIEVCDLLGMELRGMPSHTLIEEIDRDDFNAIVAQVLATPQIVELRLQGQVAGGRHITGRMILMPLKDDQGALTRILGAVTLDRELLRPPIRFTVERKNVTRIVNTKSLPLDQVVEGGMAEPYVGFMRPAKRPVQNANGPILRVVK